MADEIARPKITIVIDKADAEAALKSLKGSGADVANAFEKSLNVSLDKSSKAIKRLADEIQGGGATRKLQDLEKAIAQLGGPANVTGQNLVNLASRIKQLEAAGGKVPAQLQAIAASAKNLGAGLDFKAQGLNAIQGFTSSLGPLGSALTALGPAGIAAGAAIAIVGGSMFNASAGAVAYGSKLSDLSLKTGMSAEGLQRLEMAGAMVGVSLESASSAVFKLQNAMETAPEKFTALGMSVHALKNMAPDEAFASFAKNIAAIESPTERAAAAMSVLGRSAGELMPLLRTMALDGAGASAGLGRVLTSEMVAKLDEVDDAAAVLTKTWEGLWNNIGAAVVTGADVASVIKGIAVAVGAVSSAVQQYGPGIMTFLKTVGTIAMPGLELARRGVVALAEHREKNAPKFHTLTAVRGAVATVKANADAAREKEIQDATEKRLKAMKEAEAEAKKLSERIDQLSGKTLAADMLRDAKAIEAVGGAAKLAAKDLDGLITKYAGTAHAVQFLMERERRRNAERTILDTVGPKQVDPLSNAFAVLERRKAQGILPFPTIGDITPGLITTGEQGSELEREALAAADELERLARMADKASAAFDIAGSALDATGMLLGRVFGVDTSGGSRAGKMLGAGQNIVSGAGQAVASAYKGDVAGVIQGGAQYTLGVLDLGQQLLGGSESDKIARDVGRDFGVKISEELAKTIESEGKGRFDGALKHLGAIIAEGGGIEKFGVDKAVGFTRDLFSAMDRGTMSAKEAGAALDEVFGDIAANAINDQTGLLQANARELITLSRQYGVASEAIKAFTLEQAKSLGSSLASGLSGMKGLRDKAAGDAGMVAERQTRNRLQDSGLSDEEIEARVRRAGNAAADAAASAVGIVSQNAAGALGTSVAASFAEMVRSGMSRTEAFEAITPAVVAMREELKAAGFEGGAAFAMLEQQLAITQGEITGPLLNGVTTFSSSLVNMSNMGLLNQQTFSGMTEQINANVAALEKEGVEGPALIAAIGPSLQQIWELQQQFGFSVDETTQKYIDQGVAAGAVGQAQMSAGEQMAASMNTVVDVLKLVAEALGVTKDKIAALDGTKAEVTVNTNYTSSGSTAPPDSGGSSGNGLHGYTEFSEFAEGSGGLRKFSPFGTPALLHGEEAVLTKGQLSNLVSLASSSGYAAAARAGGSWAAPGNMGAMPSNLEVVAALGQVKDLLSTFPAAVGRSTRDAVQHANARKAS